MALSESTIEAGGAMPPATVRVWDLFIRIFHWSLVGLFTVVFATGDKIEQLHAAAGYGIATLLAARIVWGFIGRRHARFVDFVTSPATALAYVRAILRGRAPRYLGHNPVGGAMVVALMALLALLCVTGFMMTTDAFWGVKWVQELHATAANLMLGLVALHVIGVMFTSIDHGENLVKAMITGRKRER
jgi:cytochrome b